MQLQITLNSYILAEPLWLLLLLLLPLLMYWYRKGIGRRHVTLQVSRMQAMKGVKTWVVYARNWIQALRWIAIVLIIIALARPQQFWREEQIEADAIDIMIAMDISASMLSRDFRPDRLSAAKEMAAGFVGRRPYDRMGLVLFSGGAFTQCPLTNDRRVLQAFINNIQTGRLPDGTAIGMGLATSIQHLKDSPSKSRIVLLITDGENNSGELGPLTAAAIAKALGIRVYTIGIGTDGVVESPVSQNMDGSYQFAPRQMSLDTGLLKGIAGTTHGIFYRARSSDDLRAIYSEIESLEKTKVVRSTVRRSTDMFFWFLNVAFCLLVLELLLRWGPLRVITV
ncbi:MAG: VWA domain-containing protein [Lewinellaceae bacterium]|nr:VWA domain-containing protein [Saprospiraceae bacterium]MCB9356589.1 VWA domain-containing protein [Lewinellaceae bacterium]